MEEEIDQIEDRVIRKLLVRIEDDPRGFCVNTYLDFLSATEVRRSLYNRLDK